MLSRLLQGPPKLLAHRIARKEESYGDAGTTRQMMLKGHVRQCIPDLSGCSQKSSAIDNR